MAQRVCLALLVASHRDYMYAQKLVGVVHSFATPIPFLYAPSDRSIAQRSGVRAVTPFPVKLVSTAANWKIAHEKLGLFNHTIGTCDWVVSLDIDIVISKPFSELFVPGSMMEITYGMDPATYPWGMNSGVFAFRPNKELFAAVLQQAQLCPTCSDQVVLGRANVPKKILSHIYNMSPAACEKAHFQKVQQSYVKIWHFTFTQKPWNRMRLPDCVKPL